MSDRGTSFTSQLWMSLGQLLGTSIHHATAYNPEADSMVERFHQAAFHQGSFPRCNNLMWFSQLSWVLLSLRMTPKEGLDVSPAEMVFGNPLVVPSEFFPNAPFSKDIARLQRIAGKFTPYKQTYRPPKHCYAPPRSMYDEACFSSTPPLTHPYSGPFEVIERKEKAFLLLIKGTNDWTSIDCLKSAYLHDDDPPPVQFSRVGRLLSHAMGHLR
ncbi:uncharacterized protein LOC119575566 [Penaeus monodon]|uniref:uncharacterized protein LOC119575566 n=1 Tax=Penaeus monodon TaxID=6687 RepID=UPI0018A7BBAF|nr:uncharacterized protein LOC119575566 [Penaeus monodon]